MQRVIAWLRLEGDTASERLRKNPLQLALLVAVAWFFAIGTYVTLSNVFGLVPTAIIMLVGAIIVGRHLRDWLVAPSTESRNPQ